ncbi:hypothetical protein [Saccharomonospora sp. CUA-673]|uniref:hypothetical protein n=1 Tax=Saccharomonospora sp. CUA-673 TaxID=1904969 RepID=UPI00111519BB|nr:hypothetical protein [Saccharomonospora sp. CUA-673]
MSAPLRTRVRSWRRAPLRAALRAVRAWRGDRTVAALAVVAVLTLVCLAGLGVRWWAMSGSAEAQVAAARDTALEHGTQALEVLNAIDHRTAGSDVDRWLQVTDGSLHQQLKGDRDEHVARARTRRWWPRRRRPARRCPIWTRPAAPHACSPW